MKYEVEPGSGRYRNGTITFFAHKGKSLDLAAIVASLQRTRLAGNTRSGVNFLEITAKGDVAVVDKAAMLKVSGTGQQFVLGEDPKARPPKGEKTPLQRLGEGLARGEKVASVTGRVQAWSGRWPVVLQALSGESAKDAKKPPLLIVTDFQTAGK
jgi:hypothetical protein